jgi:hypothetical protein
MVIYDLNILRTFRRPHKAHAESIVYTDAVLPRSAAHQGIQPVARWNLQIFKLRRPIEHG